MVYTKHTVAGVRGASLFDWDEHNTDHVAEHDLYPEDVEEALLDLHRIGIPAYKGLSQNNQSNV